MAAYRANYLDFQGLKNAAPVPNLQKCETGFAISDTKTDEFGRPKVAFAFNRLTHDVDLATTKPPPGKAFMQQLNPTLNQASADSPKFLPAPLHTKAYKDGLEWQKAEKDFRAKEKFLDSITPSRGPWPRNLTGTAEAKSGPVPDEHGNVWHYDEPTRVMTGEVFAAPTSSSFHQPKPATLPGLPVRKPVLVETKGQDIITLPNGRTQLVDSSGVMTHAPIHTDMDVEMTDRFPGMFPSTPSTLSPSPTIPNPFASPTTVGPKPEAGPVPVKVASDYGSMGLKQAIIDHNTVKASHAVFNSAGPFTSTRHDYPRAIQLDRNILPKTHATLTNVDAPAEKGATLLDKAALEIPFSLIQYVPPAGASVVTQDVGTARTATGVVALRDPPSAARRGGARGRGGITKNSSALVRKPRTLPRVSLQDGVRLPTIPVTVSLPQTGSRRPSRRGANNIEGYIAGPSQPEEPFSDQPSGRRGSQKKLTASSPPQASSSALATRAPNTRAGSALSPQVREHVDLIAPPQAIPLRPLARRNQNDPEVGIASRNTTQTGPLRDLVRLRKAQETIHPPPAKKARRR